MNRASKSTAAGKPLKVTTVHRKYGELPPFPAIVLVVRKRRKRPEWMYHVPQSRRPVFARFDYGFDEWVPATNLKVVEHPLNSEEAVKIIRDARARG